MGLTILSSVNPLSATLLKCVSGANQECKVQSEIVNVNSDESVFYPFSIKTSKCSGSCNNINDPYAKLCVADAVQDLNVKVLSRTNEKTHIKWHETCKCKCRLDASVCNKKQRWNDDKYRCESKKLIDKGVCDKGSIWYPSNCVCECDKLCDVDEYLDYEDCKCRKILVDKLVERSSAEECTEKIEEEKLLKITLAEDKNKYKRSSRTLHIVLFSIILLKNIVIGTCFVYYKYMNHNKKLLHYIIMSIKQQIININGKYQTN